MARRQSSLQSFLDQYPNFQRKNCDDNDTRDDEPSSESGTSVNELERSVKELGEKIKKPCLDFLHVTLLRYGIITMAYQLRTIAQVKTN